MTAIQTCTPMLVINNRGKNSGQLTISNSIFLLPWELMQTRVSSLPLYKETGTRLQHPELQLFCELFPQLPVWPLPLSSGSADIPHRKKVIKQAITGVKKFPLFKAPCAVPKSMYFWEAPQKDLHPVVTSGTVGKQGADPQEVFSTGLQTQSHFILSPWERLPEGTQIPEKDNFLAPCCFKYRSAHNL